MNVEPIVTERLFDAPVATVWKALTDKSKMKKWYFDLPDFKPEKGFQFEFWEVQRMEFSTGIFAK
jgi:uncharacterized protein YndB with AHSA1/START domain